MLMILQYLFVVGGAGLPRGKIFTKEFMEERFGEEHKQATGSEITKGGYPDHGSGRYTMGAGYAAWYTFNNAQRVHYNYLEYFAQMIIQFLLAGLYYPLTTAVLAGVYILFRIWFHVGYIRGGPKGRVPAAVFCMMMQMLMPFYTIASLVYFYHHGAKTPQEA